jgi:peptidoglycan DL-endopeptidase CwlO
MSKTVRFLCVSVMAAVMSTVLVVAPFAASTSDRLRAKQTQAKAILAQVNALDAKFGATVEAWNGARYELAQVKQQLAANRTALHTANAQKQIAIRNVTERLVALYESDSPPSTLSIFLGSRSLSSMIDELDAEHAVANQDSRLAIDATQVRARYAAAVRDLQATEQRRSDALRQLATQRARIGSTLAKRRQLLRSVGAQIAALRTEEARQQRLIAEQARIRLTQEQAALRQRAAADRLAAARAQQAAEEQRKAADPAPDTATTPAVVATTTVVQEATTSPSVVASPTTDPAPTVPSPPPVPSSLPAGHPEAATIALRYLGVPYHWGGASPTGFDCSGLVMYVYAQLRISLPHYAAAQYTFGTAVPRDQLQAGDLVFFDGLNHVGIYIGAGQVVHAPETGDVVKISNVSDWGAGYVGARRI